MAVSDRFRKFIIVNVCTEEKVDEQATVCLCRMRKQKEPYISLDLPYRRLIAIPKDCKPFYRLSVQTFFRTSVRAERSLIFKVLMIIKLRVRNHRVAATYEMLCTESLHHLSGGFIKRRAEEWVLRLNLNRSKFSRTIDCQLVII